MKKGKKKNLPGSKKGGIWLDEFGHKNPKKDNLKKQMKRLLPIKK